MFFLVVLCFCSFLIWNAFPARFDEHIGERDRVKAHALLVKGEVCDVLLCLLPRADVKCMHFLQAEYEASKHPDPYRGVCLSLVISIIT